MQLNSLKHKYISHQTSQLILKRVQHLSESVISEHYVPKILVSYKNQRRYHDLHLVFDQAPCHTTQRSKAAFSSASIKVKWVGKRLTFLTQPADQSWMSPFKGRYFRKWNNWLIHAPKSYTAAGTVKSPGYSKVVEWISEHNFSISQILSMKIFFVYC